MVARQATRLQEAKVTADRGLSSPPPIETHASTVQNSASKRMRCLTFQSKAPGRAGRPDQVVQALEVVRPLEFKPGEAVIGDHRPHGEGRLELGDVHVAVGGGQRSQAAWERREKRRKVSLRHLCTPRRQTQHSRPVRKEHTLLLPTYLFSLQCGYLIL